jgi:hypothetical protein
MRKPKDMSAIDCLNERPLLAYAISGAGIVTASEVLSRESALDWIKCERAIERESARCNFRKPNKMTLLAVEYRVARVHVLKA